MICETSDEVFLGFVRDGGGERLKALKVEASVEGRGAASIWEKGRQNKARFLILWDFISPLSYNTRS